VIYVDKAYFTEISPLSRQLIKSAGEAARSRDVHDDEWRGGKERERERGARGDSGKGGLGSRECEVG